MHTLGSHRVYIHGIHQILSQRAWCANCVYNRGIHKIGSWSNCAMNNSSHFSQVKRNQLDATCFIITLFSAQHVSDVNTSILRSLRLIRSYFMDCIWFGVCWRSVSVWLSVCSLKHDCSSASDCIQIPHHHSHTETERQHTPNQIQPMK